MLTPLRAVEVVSDGPARARISLQRQRVLVVDARRVAEERQLDERDVARPRVDVAADDEDVPLRDPGGNERLAM